MPKYQKAVHINKTIGTRHVKVRANDPGRRAPQGSQETEGESQDQGMRLTGGLGKLLHAPRLEAKSQYSS